MSSMQVAEEVMKESVAAYLDAPKSANSEILRRLINVIIHRLSVVVNNLVIALEVPNAQNPAKLDILRIRVEQFTISDSSQETSYTQALDISYSAVYNRSEKKTVKIHSFSVELFEIDESEKNEMLHLTSLRSPILSIPGTTELNLELSMQPFSFRCAVNLDHVNIGLDSPQLGILGSLSQKLTETLSKAPPPSKPSANVATTADKTLVSEYPPSAVHAPSAGESTDDDDEFDDAEDGSDYDSDYESSDDDNSSAVLVLRKDPVNSKASETTQKGVPSVNIRASDGPIAMSQNETVFGRRENLSVDISVSISFLQLAIVPNSSTSKVSSPIRSSNGIKSPMSPVSGLTSSASSFATATSSPVPSADPSSPASKPSPNNGIFTLDSLAEPSKLNHSFVLFRFKDLGVKSSQDAGGNSRIRAVFTAFAVHENYKVDPIELANVPESSVLGESSSAGYLTYPVIRIHPHSKSKADPNAPPTAWALRLRHAIEHKIPTTDIEIDQISITLPGKLPKLLSHILDDLSKAFTSPNGSQNAQGDASGSGPNSGRSSSSGSESGLGVDASSSNAASLSLESNPEKRRFAGLVDSSSSSEPDGVHNLAASSHSNSTNEATSTQNETVSEDEHSAEEEAPPPTKRTVKIGHVFVSLRVPVSVANRYSFPVYRQEFIAAYIKRPVATLYSSNSTSNSAAGHPRRSNALPNDTIEFDTVSLFLLNNVKDITILARSPDAPPSKRYSGSDSSVPKYFLKFTASSSHDMPTEAVSIHRRTTPLPDVTELQQTVHQQHQSTLSPSNASPSSRLSSSATSHQPLGLSSSFAGDDYRRSGSGIMPPLGPSMTVLSDYAGRDSAQMKDTYYQSANGGDMGASSVPKFVQQSFESAPFSSVTARFEGETQVPSSMDDETFDNFRTRVMAHSDLAVTVTVHELELELEKSQADLIQELLDGMTASDNDGNGVEELGSGDGRSHEEIEAGKAAGEFVKLSRANAIAALYTSTGALYSGFSLELRVNFASIRLTTAVNASSPSSASGADNKLEYRFSNVESLRLLFVSQYLHTSKSFMVLQVGALRLPSTDALPNTPPILSKIPEFGYEEAKVLTVILSMESLPAYWKKRSTVASQLGFRKGSVSPPANDAEEEDIASRMTILVEPNRLAIEYRLGERWIGDLSGFFIRDVPVDLSRPKQEVRLFVHARSSSVSLRGNIATSVPKTRDGLSNVADPVALLHMDKLVVTSRLIIPSDPLLNSALTFNFRAHMVQLFIIDDKGRVWLKPSEGAHVKTLRQYWIARGYSPCGFIESLFSQISMNSLSLPKLSIDVNLNATLDTTGDQLYAITQLLSSLSTASPESLAPSEIPVQVKANPSPTKKLAPSSSISSIGSNGSSSSEVQQPTKSSSSTAVAAPSAPSSNPDPSSRDVHSSSMNEGLIPVDSDEEEEEEIIFQGSSSRVLPPHPVSSEPSNASEVDQEFVLVRMTPAQQQAHQREVEREEWLKTFKLSQHPPPHAPIARFIGKDSDAHNRMPRLIENYKPEKMEEHPPVFSFVFKLASSEFIIRLREGISLLDDEDTAVVTAAVNPGASGDPAPTKHLVGTRREHRDVLSSDPAPHVNVHLRGLRVTLTNDDLDQSETKVMIKKFFFRSSRDGPSARPFVDFDRGALSNATHMLTLTLSSMYDLGEDTPALHQQSSQIRALKEKNGRLGDDSPVQGAKHSNGGAQNSMQPSSVLVFTLLPLAVRVDIDALEFMRTFYATFSATQPALAAHMAANTASPSPAAQTRSATSTASHRQRSGSSSKMTAPSPSQGKGRSEMVRPASPAANAGPHFHRVSISSISLNLNVSAWALRMDDAVIQLPSLYCRGVEGWDGVGAELAAAYQPLLYSSLFTFAGSLPVVRLVLSVLGSVSNLVISPYEEYQRGRSPASGAYGAITVGATSVASELLRFGAWVSSTAGDGLQYLESFWRRPDTSKTAAPSNLQQGAQLGYSNMVRQVAAARDCLVVMPWKEYKRHQSVLGLVAGVTSAVPLAILKPVIGVTHGLSNVMQGASNAIHVPGRAKDHARAADHASTSPASIPTTISPNAPFKKPL